MPAPKGHPPYPGCETGGRPPRFNIEEEAEAFEAWMKKPDSIWYKDFALDRGYLPDQLSEWAKKNEKFACVYKKSQEWQQSKLVKGGLLGIYNAGFTKFVMGNTCGWAERSQTQVSGDTCNPLEFILNRIDGATKDLITDEQE